MTYADFRYNMVETDESGPWGDNYFSKTFDKYVDDGMIEIEYKYGRCVDWNTEIIWKIPETEKAYKVRYGHSSPFAMWWCSLTDEIEEEAEWNSSDEEESDCEFCGLEETECVTKKEGVWSDCRGYVSAPRYPCYYCPL